MADTVLELIEVSKRFDQTVTADRFGSRTGIDRIGQQSAKSGDSSR